MSAMGPLVDTSWLRERLGTVAVVDCRYTLGQPGAGEPGYLAGHVPGAAFLDLDRDLAAPPDERGRHPLPAAENFERAARRAGINDGSPVIAYDEAGEASAARLWWLLGHFGHRQVSVLDGGLAAWRSAGLPLATGVEEVPEGDFTARVREGDTVEADDLTAGERLLLDARAPERFRGETEPIDPVAGHIPGARNMPFAELAPGGAFLPPAELRERLDGPARQRGTSWWPTAAPGSRPARSSWPPSSPDSARPACIRARGASGRGGATRSRARTASARPTAAAAGRAASAPGRAGSGRPARPARPSPRPRRAP